MKRFTAFFCVLTLSVMCVLSYPTDRGNQNNDEEIPRLLNGKTLIRKRSTNADIGLNGSRSSRMQQLLRRYMLLTILENVKGKRSWKSDKFPTHSDGSLDYDSIAGVVLRNEPHRSPWYLVDMKRDVHSTPKGFPELYELDGMSLRRTSDPEKDILHELPRMTDEITQENFPLLQTLMQAANDQRNAQDQRLGELASDEMEGNTEAKLIDLLKN